MLLKDAPELTTLALVTVRWKQHSDVPDGVPALKPSPYSACPEPLW